MRLPITVFISGGGTTLRNLIARRDRGELGVDIQLVVSSSAKAKGLEFAEDAGIETLTVRKRDFTDETEYCDAMFNPVRLRGSELVVMAGFLQHVLIPPDYTNRVINIHPSLIPSFCGAGMYGGNVHSAVLEYGAKVSGCTVHFVDNQYDNGPIILQRTCPVLDNDTPEALAARVFQQECIALPEAIEAIGRGRVTCDGRKVAVREQEVSNE